MLIFKVLFCKVEGLTRQIVKLGYNAFCKDESYRDERKSDCRQTEKLKLFLIYNQDSSKMH